MQLDVGSEPTLGFVYLKYITLKCIICVVMKLVNNYFLVWFLVQSRLQTESDAYDEPTVQIAQVGSKNEEFVAQRSVIYDIWPAKCLQYMFFLSLPA